MINSVLFDLGITLIRYYPKDEFTTVLSEAINECQKYLISIGINFPKDELWEKVKTENYESPDYKVRPLEERLKVIFNIQDSDLLEKLCEIFMSPIFSLGETYDDVKHVLNLLHEKGLKTAIVSNSPWGSPSNLWMHELHRRKLTPLIDEAVFCRDVGWRKPDQRIFKYTLTKLKNDVSQCIFVGDDPRWDVIGPSQLGMKSILIDRTKSNPDAIHDLFQIFNFLK